MDTIIGMAMLVGLIILVVKIMDRKKKGPKDEDIVSIEKLAEGGKKGEVITIKATYKDGLVRVVLVNPTIYRMLVKQVALKAVS